MNCPPVLGEIEYRYRQSLGRYKADVTDLAGLDADILGGLRRVGYHVSSLTDLNIAATTEMTEAAEETGRILRGRADQDGSSKRSSYAASALDMRSHPALFRWGLQHRLLRIAKAYVGLPIAYDGIHALYTIADGRQTDTRNWHRDREDRRVLKVAVYVNGVRDDGGPLQFLRQEISTTLAMQYAYPILSHEEVERRLGRPLQDDDVVTCCGDRGTVVFSDTARLFHRGKPAIANDRFAVYFHYFSRNPRHPFFCARSGLTAADLRDLVFGLGRAEAEAALWSAGLPRWASLIPKGA